MTKNAKFESVRKNIEHYLSTDWFMWVCFLIACFITVLRVEAIGLLIFAAIICAILVFCEDVIIALEPFLLLCLCLIKCNNSYDEFIKMVWLAVPAAAAIIFHFIYYQRKLPHGELFWPMLAVSVAVTLGGLGKITAKEYFSLMPIFFTLGLGFGMLLFYNLMNSHIRLRENYSLPDKISKIMIIMGLFCCFMILEYYGEHLDKVLSTHGLLAFQWRNNASTFLIFALPFAFLRSIKGNHGWFWVGMLFYGCMMITGSRGGAIVGTAEVMMCMIALLCFDKRHRVHNIIIISVGIVMFFVFFWDLIYFFRDMLLRLLQIDDNEIRVRLMRRAVEDFLSNPVFGRGLGYFGNRDVHHSAKGALCWYHSSPFQVIGSFGIVGIAAYGYIFVARIVYFARRNTLTNKFIFIAYIGMQLMSLVNPGLFSPVPYLLMMTLLFVIMDKIKDDPEEIRLTGKAEKNLRRSKKKSVSAQTEKKHNKKTAHHCAGFCLNKSFNGLKEENLMSFLPMTEYESSSEEVKREYKDQIAKHGRITNMKRTLLHNVPAFKAYMEWYTLYDQLVPVIGDRAISLFSHAISEGNECLICSIFFRKILIDSGDDPDNPHLSDTEKLLVDFGGAICKDPHNIPDEIYNKLSERFSTEEIVLLIAFAGIMYATNLFNTVAKVPLDEVLYKYRKDGDTHNV